MQTISSAAVDAAMNDSEIGGTQYGVAGLCAMLLVFDGYDLGAIGYAIPAIASDWKVAPVALTEALVLSGVGMLLGSMISGPVGISTVARACWSSAPLPSGSLPWDLHSPTRQACSH